MAVDVSRLWEGMPDVARPPGLTGPAPESAHNRILREWIARHGAVQGEGFPTNPIIDSADPNSPTGKGANPDPALRYTFADGTTLDLTKNTGQIKDYQFSQIAQEKLKANNKTTAEVYKDPWGGQYVIDPTKPWEEAVQVLGGDVTKAAVDQTNLTSLQAVLREKNKNASEGKGFVTDADAAQNQRDLESGVLKRDEFNQKVLDSQRQYALDVQTEARLRDTATAQIAKTGAETAGIGVETQVNQQRLKQLVALEPHDLRKAELANQVTVQELQQMAALFPAKLQQMEDSGAYTKAQVDELRQKMRAPTTTSLGEGPYYATRTPEGQIQQQMTLGYQPKTQAEIAARIGQIQAASQAKQQELLAKVDAEGGYTAEQAAADYQQWHAQNVESQRAGIEAAQEEAQFGRAKQIAEMQRLNQAQSLAAGNQAIAAHTAQAGTRVGSRMGEVANQLMQGKSMKDIDVRDSFVYQAPDLQDQVSQANAASMAGTGGAGGAQGGPPPGMSPYAGIDIAGAWDKTRWMGPQGGGQPAPAPGAGPAATPEQAAGGPGGWNLASGPQQQPLLPPGAAGVPVAPYGPAPRMTQAGPPPGVFTPNPGESSADALKRMAMMNPQDAWNGYNYQFGG